jgi:membrane peptidoglycan carboxypeptidase
MGADEPSETASAASSDVQVVPEEPDHRDPQRPPRWRRRALVAAAVVLTLVGAGLAGAAYYYRSVEYVGLRPLPASTVLYYADGTVLARLGHLNRDPVALGQMIPTVAQVAVAAEDPDFWTSHAGAITRSVARQAADIRDDSTSAWARVGVIAWKVEDAYSKEEILDYYLNSVPFGRNAYGVEAAARVYFGKTARVAAPPEQQLTLAEVMALVARVDRPEDPDAAVARQRWGEIRDAMVDAGALTAAEAAALTYPEPRPPVAGPSENERPAAIVVNHVLDELSHTGGAFKDRTWESIETGGYSIYTTLDSRAQAALESTADETVAGSVMNGQPQQMVAAAVVVEPGTGRVLAYYGGHEGLGNDYAGFYYDQAGEATGFGRYPPGQSFVVHTLAAALKAGISLRSTWQWTPHEQVGRPQSNPIRNASRCTSDASATGVCSLLDSTTQSLNVPFYDVTLSVSPAKVLEMSRDAGIDYMWNDDWERQDLRSVTNWGEVTPSKFDIFLGIGQYPVTVLDQANAMATYASGGLRARAHFVAKVIKGDEIVVAEALPNPDQPRVLGAAAAADLTYALSLNPSGQLPAIDSASKTGVWEYANRADANAHAWMVGYTSSLAMAVHIGSRAEETPLIDRNGATVWGSGLPAMIYRAFMTKAYQDMKLIQKPFAPPVFGGRLDPPLSVPG